jgi:hypothetical protein
VRKFILAILFLAISPLFVAQQALNNDAIIKLVKAGLTEDLIVTTVNGSPGSYDTSADGIIALKTAGVSDKVIAAIVAKTSAPAPVAPTVPTPAPAAGSGTVPVPPNAEPQIRLSLCEFEVNGTTASGNNGAMIGGLAGAAIAGSHRHEYFADINQEVQHVYESAIMQSGSIQYVKSEKPADSAGGTPPVSADSAAQNQPYVCANANPYWGTKMGFNKELSIMTTWRVEYPNGCKLKFKTSVSTRQTYGKFPTGANPALKSAYLELSREDAREFVLTMKKAGCVE